MTGLPPGAAPDPGRVLVLLDAVEQIDSADDDLLRSPATTVVVALPQIGLALAERGIAFVHTDAFFDLYSLRPIDRDLYESLTRLCRTIDEHAMDLVPDYRTVDFRPFSDQLFFLRIVVDTVFIRLSEATAAILAVRPERLVCFDAPPAMLDDTLLPAASLSLYGKLAPALGRKYGIAIDVRPFTPPAEAGGFRPPPPVPARSFTRSFARFARRLRSGATQIRHLAARTVRDWTGGGGRVLSLQTVVDETLLQRHLTVFAWSDEMSPVHRDGRIAFWPRAVAADVPAGLWDQLRALSDAARSFHHEGLDCFDPIEPYLRHLAEDLAPRLFRMAGMAGDVIARTRPGAVLVFNSFLPFIKTVIARARHLGIPVIGTHHGQLGDQIDGSWRYCEFPYCDHYLVYTGAAGEFIADWAAPSFRMHVTGSPHLERTRCRPGPSKQEVCRAYGLDPRRPLLLYPTVPANGHAIRIAVHGSNARVLRIQTAIVDAVARHPEIQLIVKGLPNIAEADMPVMGHIRRLGRPDIRFVNDRSFTHFLDAADGFVIDHPGLTLMEVLTRDKPAFIVNNTYVWRAEAVEALRADTVFEHELDDFLPRFEAALASGAAFTGRRSGNTFFQRYGDDRGDGGSTRRAIEAITRIAGETHRKR